MTGSWSGIFFRLSLLHVGKSCQRFHLFPAGAISVMARLSVALTAIANVTSIPPL
jgi:hypothetical protein